MYLARGQTHMGQICKIPQRRTTTGYHHHRHHHQHQQQNTMTLHIYVLSSLSSSSSPSSSLSSYPFDISVLSMSHPIGLTAPGYAEHRLSKRLCLVSQCQPGHIESLVCHRWAETRPYTWSRCSSHRPPVDQWCRCTAFTASTWWSCCQHPCSRQHRDSCLIL